jgi:hypothetical protein
MENGSYGKPISSHTKVSIVVEVLDEVAKNLPFF